mgnify:CR=1 FL=1
MKVKVGDKLPDGKVLLLEKEEFPRDKVCGDAVGGKALRHLEELIWVL